MRSFLLSAAFGLCGAPAFSAAFIFGFTDGPAGTLTINTTTGTFINNAFMSGWYDSTGVHNSTNQNYSVFDPSPPCPDCASATNDFFSFRLGNGIITGTVLSATFSAPNPLNGYSGPDTGVLMLLWDVMTPVDTVDGSFPSGSAEGIAIFNDLGSGTPYSQRLVGPSDAGTTVVFALNTAALAAIQSAAAIDGSSLFAIGGALSPVPEPPTWALMCAGVLGLISLTLFRRRQT